ncbi:MAG: winged helix-turn-helix transcriptional regulator [Woeseiaceae bacterium]|nr:winged helix-turn-helix transcriptional regulator [Woeseiaceae bacterium]
MERTSFSASPCSIARSLDVLGDWWNPLIIRECLYGVHRFDDYQKNLGIGRNILTRRLKQLVTDGVLERRQYQDKPNRFGYHLTEKGYDAARVLLGYMSFGEKWYFESSKDPIRLYDRESGRRVVPELVDAATGKVIDPKNLYAGPGPGFPDSEVARRERFAEFFERAR